jgi:arylsulfatase
MHESAKGSINGEFTLNIDLAPTLLSAAGIEVPRYMQGRDMAALYTGDDYEQAQKGWRKDFFYEFSWKGKDIRPAPPSFNSPNPPVFALISKVYKVRRAIVRVVGRARGDTGITHFRTFLGACEKYFYWPLKQYHQLFHMPTDPFEERDVMNTTDRFVVQSIQARYEHLRNLSQSGHPV